MVPGSSPNTSRAIRCHAYPLRDRNGQGDSTTCCSGSKLAALVLVVAALGLPINDLPRYSFLVISAVVICTGALTRRRNAWLAAITAVLVSVLGQTIFAAPRIEEGHNLFLIDGPDGALEAGLPPSVFQFMSAQFNARYPPERRCQPSTYGCWRGGGFPQTTYAFSADGIRDHAAYSRWVTGIDFSDPVWLRLGFINERDYNWSSTLSDISRAGRDHRFWAFLHPWRLEMPWFVMYRFPADFAGSSLCWRGDVLWEGTGGSFERISHASLQCHMLTRDDAGRQIFGVAIRQEPPLGMQLEPSLRIRTAHLIEFSLALVGAAAVLSLLVRSQPRRSLLALALIALTLVIVMLNDASFIGGLRPFDGGDDGLVYDGVARLMLRQIAAGDITGALEGGAKVFYYTPGLPYLRTIEHLLFGETYLGYLSLILLLPFLVLALFRRFLPVRWSLALTLIFVAIPIGVLFGSSLVQYVKWAAQGFADPAAYIFFLAGLVLLVGCSSRSPRMTFAAAWGAGFMFALALFVRPNIAPAAGILLAGSGIAALWQRQYRRLAGLVIGFLPVLGMPLHNWVYGGVFVLFTSTATIPGTLVMPPSAYVAALRELVRFDLAGEHIARALRQIGGWLAGPSESFVMVPVNAAAIVLLFRVATRKQIDPWLRLTAGATIAQQCVGIFYASAGRYHYLTWLLTLLVAAVWLHEQGIDLLQRQYPVLAARVASHPARIALGRILQRISAAELTSSPFRSRISPSIRSGFFR